MSGLIRITKEKNWGAAGWVFDHVLRLTRRHLPKEHSAGIVKLFDYAEESGMEYVTLEGLSPEEMKILRGAFEDSYQEVLAGGPRSLAEPTFYQGFVERFKELLELMPSDT